MRHWLIDVSSTYPPSLQCLFILKIDRERYESGESRQLTEMSNCDKSKINSGEAKKRRPKWLITLIALVVVSVLAVAGVFAWRAYEHRRHYSALSSCSQAVDNLNRLTRPFMLARYREAEAVQADQVKDVKIINAMSHSVKVAGGLRPPTVQCKASMSTDALNAEAGKARRIDGRFAVVAKSARAVLASRDARALDDAKAALDGKKVEASRLLADSDGKVADNATRDGLQQAIDQAGRVRSGKAKAYQDAADALQAAIDQVNASVQAKSQADQQAAAQAAQAQAAQQAQQQYAAQQQAAPSYGGGGGYRPTYRPSYNQGGGNGGGNAGGGVPTQTAPQGGGSSWRDRLNNQKPIGNHGCNPDGSCGIG